MRAADDDTVLAPRLLRRDQTFEHVVAAALYFASIAE
jgi:hypothetical protein